MPLRQIRLAEPFLDIGKTFIQMPGYKISDKAFGNIGRSGVDGLNRVAARRHFQFINDFNIRLDQLQPPFVQARLAGGLQQSFRFDFFSQIAAIEPCQYTSARAIFQQHLKTHRPPPMKPGLNDHSGHSYPLPRLDLIDRKPVLKLFIAARQPVEQVQRGVNSKLRQLRPALRR